MSCGTGLSGAYRNTISWRTPTPAADGKQSAGRVRAAVRRRQHGRAARARGARKPRACSTRCSTTRRALQRTLPGDGPRAARALPRGRARGRAAHRARRAKGRRRPRRARQAGRRARRLRAAREADVRSAGAGVGGGSHARRHADDREGGQQRRVSRERHQRSVPQPVAPLRSPGEHRALRELERVPHEHDARVFPRASCTTRPTATARCSITRSCSTAAA